MRVCRYVIPAGNDRFSLDLPGGAKIIAIREQYGMPQLWAMVEEGNPTERRNFLLVVNGDPIKESPEKLNYVGTFQFAGGDLVGHVFEVM